jgi:hypothetical protein
LDKYIKILGAIPPIHREICKHYNSNVRDSAASDMCIIHQPFREKVANQIKMGNKPIQYRHLACKARDGSVKLVEGEIKSVGIQREEIVALTQTDACVYAFMEK